MSATAFDTHRTVKRLIQAGFSPEQAETVTDVLSETRTQDLSELATKADMREIRAEMKEFRAELAELRADVRTVETTLRAEIRTVEATLNGRISDISRTTLQWVVGLFVAQTAVIAGLIKLLAGH